MRELKKGIRIYGFATRRNAKIIQNSSKSKLKIRYLGPGALCRRKNVPIIVTGLVWNGQELQNALLCSSAMKNL